MAFPAPSPSDRLVPALTLADLFGPGVAYTSRRSPSLRGWGPAADGVLDFQTGNQLTIAGRMPCIASAAVATPPALQLLADAGLPVEAELHLYRSPAEYIDLLHRVASRGLRLAAQRPHPPEELPPAASVVPADLLSDLNDKGRMEDLVPDEWLPPRRVLEISELPPPEELLAGGEPVVLKVATPLPSGGGHGVWVCCTPADVEAARGALSRERFVVVERFLRVRRSVCVHGVARLDGTVSITGFAEEVCDADGRWLGNWLDAEADTLPAEVPRVVREILAAAATRGYRGIAGVDVAFPENGPPRVLDLNFRVNGSTAAAWLRRSVEGTRGLGSMRLRSWTCESGFDDLLRVVRGAIERRSLVPLCLYDPGASAAAGLPRLNGILTGPSRGAVRAEERRLAADGLA